jgi:hypothetical protein
MLKVPGSGIKPRIQIFSPAKKEGVFDSGCGLKTNWAWCNWRLGQRRCPTGRLGLIGKDQPQICSKCIENMYLIIYEGPINNKYKAQKWGNSILWWRSLSIFLGWAFIYNQVFVFCTFLANLSFFLEKLAGFRRWAPADRCDTAFVLVLNYTNLNSFLDRNHCRRLLLFLHVGIFES